MEAVAVPEVVAVVSVPAQRSSSSPIVSRVSLLPVERRICSVPAT